MNRRTPGGCVRREGEENRRQVAMGLAKEASQAAALLALAALLSTAVRGQATDGDEQFQAYHQDIGRISGHHSQVAPNTIVRQLATTSAPVPTAPAPFERGPIRASHQQQPTSPRQQVSAGRKPHGNQRVTLAMRPHRPSAVVAGTENAPEPVYSQQLPATLLQSTAPLALAQAPPVVESQPAPSSFGPSVSARHSALMAQVAAERQAALATASAGANSYAEQAPPSLGQPLEALSSPPASQVQPPPSLFGGQQQAASQLVNQAEEPQVAPSFEHVLSSGCPRKGLFSYPNKDHCDRYYMCTNGTFTEEACPNGLAYGQQGAVYQHCAYQWNVDCQHKRRPEPIASAGCPWQFGIFPVESAGRCSIDYFVCEWGVPETKRCQPEGLFYDDRIKGCQWADQLGCKSEQLLNFKCPAEDEENPYWPFPRYYHTKQDVVVCVNEQPRLVHCNEDQAVDPSSLACMDLDRKKKNKKKIF